MSIFSVVKGLFSGKPLAEVIGIRTEELKDKEAERMYAKSKLVSAIGRSLFMLIVAIAILVRCA